MPVFIDPSYIQENEMIFVDRSELREDSRLPLGDLTFQVATDLEELTGADIMISPLSIPATSEFLIRKHIAAGAVLVQRKYRMDLVSSLGERLRSSISRMRATDARQAQCVLLFIGILTCDHEGMAQIDGQLTGRGYWAVLGGLESWVKYGGTLAHPLSKLSLVPDWLRHKEAQVKDWYENPTKTFIRSSPEIYEVDRDDPLQELVMISDWRRTVACCPGWGEKKVSALRETMLSNNASDTLLAALAWMTTEEWGCTVPGVGKGLVTKAREWLGLEENFIVLAMPEGYIEQVTTQRDSIEQVITQGDNA